MGIIFVATVIIYLIAYSKVTNKLENMEKQLNELTVYKKHLQEVRK